MVCIILFILFYYFNLTPVLNCTSTRTYSRALPNTTPWTVMCFISMLVALTEKTEMVVIDSWPTSPCLSQVGACCGSTRFVPPEADKDWLCCLCHQGLVTCRSAATDTHHILLPDVLQCQDSIFCLEVKCIHPYNKRCSGRNVWHASVRIRMRWFLKANIILSLSILALHVEMASRIR